MTTSSDPKKVLLDLVERERETRCREILEEAQREAAEVVAKAEKEAEQRLWLATRDEQKKMRLDLREDRARRNSQDHRRKLEHLAWKLSTGRGMLADALQLRWDDRQLRTVWLARVVERASKSLPPGCWKVIHPPGWDSAELEPWKDRIAGCSGGETRFVPDSGIQAGLRIESEETALDGTVSGLTANTAELDAMLLKILGDDASRENGNEA